MKLFYRLINTLLVAFFFSSMAIAQITYVNGTALGAGDGTSWTDAYTDLNSALEAATNGEIWISEGTYTPINIELDTFNTFAVAREISIYGGFAGTETTKEERVLGENTTILSGDILGNDIDNNFTTNKEDNVFHIMMISSPDLSTIILDGITFRGGHTREASDNDDLSWRGGAIYSFNTLNITNCNFNNNFARSAGSIYLVSGTPGGSNGSTIDNCVFERNACVTQGAGVFATTIDDVTISNSTFQNNTTNRGALYPIFCNNFSVDNCIFQNNISTNSSNFGGAMFIWNSTGTIRDCTFESNNTGNGAAIHIDGREMAESVASNFVFDNCIFSGNFASDFGGGAIRSFSASYTVRDCEFNSNFSANGGAIFSSGDGQNIVGINNTFIGNTADFGASQANYGSFSNYSFTNNTYAGNVANTSGGGLINGFGANVMLDNCNFMSNIASFGGAIFNQNDTTNVEIINSNFIENTVGDGNGGAINISGPVTLTVDKCLFQTNTGGFGGAINGSEGQVDVIEGYLHLSNSIILLNTASTQGAGISLVDLDLEMTNTVIGTNITLGSGAGGGISLNSTANRTATFNITNSTIADNFAFIGGGISAFAEDETSNCIVNLQNTILANEGLNFEIEDGTPIINSLGGNISSDATLEGIFTNTRDKNNIDDLKFINSDNSNFDIEDDSPAVNNGIAEGAPETDILGNPRVGAPDAGSYENQDPLGIEVIENSGQLSLMPNPAHSNSTISLSNDWTGNIRVSILDGSGKLISNSIQQKTDREFLYNLDLNGLNAGNYILSMQSKDQKISTSFIKI